MKFSSIERLIGCSMLIIGFALIIKYDFLTIEWLGGILGLVAGVTYINSADITEIKEQFMID